MRPLDVFPPPSFSRITLTLFLSITALSLLTCPVASEAETTADRMPRESTFFILLAGESNRGPWMYRGRWQTAFNRWYFSEPNFAAIDNATVYTSLFPLPDQGLIAWMSDSGMVGVQALPSHPVDSLSPEVDSSEWRERICGDDVPSRSLPWMPCESDSSVSPGAVLDDTTAPATYGALTFANTSAPWGGVMANLGIPGSLPASPADLPPNSPRETIAAGGDSWIVYHGAVVDDEDEEDLNVDTTAVVSSWHPQGVLDVPWPGSRLTSPVMAVDRNGVSTGLVWWVGGFDTICLHESNRGALHGTPAEVAQETERTRCLTYSASSGSTFDFDIRYLAVSASQPDSLFVLAVVASSDGSIWQVWHIPDAAKAVYEGNDSLPSGRVSSGATGVPYGLFIDPSLDLVHVVGQQDDFTVGMWTLDVPPTVIPSPPGEANLEATGSVIGERVTAFSSFSHGEDDPAFGPIEVAMIGAAGMFVFVVCFVIPLRRWAEKRAKNAPAPIVSYARFGAATLDSGGDMEPVVDWGDTPDPTGVAARAVAAAQNMDYAPVTIPAAPPPKPPPPKDPMQVRKEQPAMPLPDRDAGVVVVTRSSIGSKNSSKRGKRNSPGRFRNAPEVKAVSKSEYEKLDQLPAIDIHALAADPNDEDAADPEATHHMPKAG